MTTTAAATALLGALLAPGTATAATVLAPPAAASAAMTGATVPDDGSGRTQLVMDASGSMAEPAGGGLSKIDAAKTALRGAISSFPDDAEVGFRVFGATVESGAGSCEDSQETVAPATGNRSELRAAVDDYEPFGETPIPYALRQAADDLGDEGPRSILLVSDGESNCPPDPCDVAAELAEDGIDLRIDVVGLGVSGQAREQLRCIADEGGGTYYDAEDADDIEESLERAAERAVRPFTLVGEPVEGGTEDDPTQLGEGDWIQQLGEDDEPVHFAIEKSDPDSTLRVSSVAQAERSIVSLGLDLQGPEGAVDCQRSSEAGDMLTPSVISVDVVADGEESCAEGAGTYLLEVAAGATGPDQPLQLRVTEEPPVSDVGWEADGELPPDGAEVDGPATDVVGGSSFVDATELDDGRWASDVVAGEVLLYRVPLEVGQGLEVAVEFDGGEERNAGLGLYNPMQARLDPAEGTEDSGRVPATTLTGAVPAVSRGRELTAVSGPYAFADATMAGDYYLAVALSRDDEGETVVRPFTLDVEVTGEPQEGPTYADGLRWSVATGTVGGEEPEEPTGQGPEEPEEPQEPADARDDAAAPESGAEEEGGLPVVLVGGGVALGGALLALLLLVRSARPRSRPR